MSSKRPLAGYSVPAPRKRPASAALPGVDAALRPPKRAPTLGGQTKQQRQEAGRLGGRHRVQRGVGHQFTSADASAAGKKGRAKQLSQQLAAKAQQKQPKPR